jgi:hypothetical protein
LDPVGRLSVLAVAALARGRSVHDPGEVSM